MKSILYKLGRMLQVLGMIILPIAIAGNLAPRTPLDLRASLTLSGFGVAMFAIGWGIQQLGRSE